MHIGRLKRSASATDIETQPVSTRLSNWKWQTGVIGCCSCWIWWRLAPIARCRPMQPVRGIVTPPPPASLLPQSFLQTQQLTHKPRQSPFSALPNSLGPILYSAVPQNGPPSGTHTYTCSLAGHAGARRAVEWPVR